MSNPSARDDGCFGSRVELDRVSAWLRVSGELDIAGVDGLGCAFDELRATGRRHLGLDLTRLTFIDVAGLRALRAESLETRVRGGTLTIIPSACYERLLALCGMKDLTVVLPPPARRRGSVRLSRVLERR